MHEDFEQALPTIKRVAKFRLRHLEGERLDDAIQETLALCWDAYRRLCLQGRDPTPLVGKIAEFSTRRVRCGRGLVNGEPVRDAMSAQSRHRHGYEMESIPLS